MSLANRGGDDTIVPLEDSRSSCPSCRRRARRPSGHMAAGLEPMRASMMLEAWRLHAGRAEPTPGRAHPSSRRGGSFALYKCLLHPIWARAPSGRMHLSPCTSGSFIPYGRVRLRDRCTVPIVWVNPSRGRVRPSGGRGHLSSWIPVLNPWVRCPRQRDGCIDIDGSVYPSEGKMHPYPGKDAPVRRDGFTGLP
jgi:hypothetical protein